MSIPTEKLSEIVEICKGWQKATSIPTGLPVICQQMRQTCQILSKPDSALFCLTLQFTLKNITLDAEFTKDLKWFNKFLENFNGVAFFDKKQIDHQIHLDASLIVSVERKFPSINTTFFKTCQS